MKEGSDACNGDRQSQSLLAFLGWCFPLLNKTWKESKKQSKAKQTNKKTGPLFSGWRETERGRFGSSERNRAWELVHSMPQGHGNSCVYCSFIYLSYLFFFFFCQMCNCVKSFQFDINTWKVATVERSSYFYVETCVWGGCVWGGV